MAAAAYLERVRANGKRVLEDLHRLRSFGAAPPYVATSKGGDGVSKGVVRPALSHADIEARQWLMERASEAGLEPEMDGIGTTIARGTSTGPRLLAGSHSDTQPEGGWLDGALGVVFALEAARALAEAGGPAAIDVVNWQDEEGRFGTLVGSSAYVKGAASVDFGAWSGSPESAAPRETLAEAAQARGLHGRPLFEHPAVVAEGGTAAVAAGAADAPYLGYFEAHIEQGLRLVDAGHAVGAVSSIVGLRQFVITFMGDQNHAGTTTMATRRDAARAAFGFAHDVHERFGALAGADSHAVWTIGQCTVKPGAVSIVPSEAKLTLQFRDPTTEALDAMEAALEEAIEAVRVAEGAAGVQVAVAAEGAPVAPVAMDSSLLEHVRVAAEQQASGSWQELHSAAIHDAGMLAARMPAAMLFVPSINGVSHDFAEDTAEEDIVRGAQVYALAAARMVAGGAG